MIKLLDLIKEYKITDPIIYLDMDGVVADFERRFEDLAGMDPRQYETEYGKKQFWNFIDEEHKVSFWTGIPLMKDAKTLVDYISKYNYNILTSPSVKEQSTNGKKLWVKDKVEKGIFPNYPKINFKFTGEKHTIKPKLTVQDILIDDNKKNITPWIKAGGIGILHTSPQQTIKELKELGL
jgi:5'(3')-deoxyribonucleotidase